MTKEIKQEVGENEKNPTLPPPEEYQPEQFVNRQVETDEIGNKVQQAQLGPIRQPIVNYSGIAGIGKSWLLHHISELYKFPSKEKVKPTFSLSYDFKENTQDITSDIINSFVQQITKQFENHLTPEDQNILSHTIDEIKTPKSFASFIREFSKNYVPIISFDDAHIVENWEEIELKIIEPLAITNRILVIIAGRKEIPHWHSFETRKRVSDTEKTSLKAFSIKETENQLNNRNIPLPADKVHQYAAGSPRLTDVIAEKMSSKDYNKNKLVEVLKAAEAEILSTTPKELRFHITNLFSLRYFQTSAVRFYYENQENSASEKVDPPDVYYLNILRDFEFESDTVQWEKAKRAYMFNPIVRNIISHRILLEDQEKFIDSHNRSLSMYWSWAEKSPKLSEEYILEILFHTASIYEANQDLENLKKKIGEVLDFVNKNLSIDRQSILLKQIADDQELHDLIPSDEYRRLTSPNPS